MGENPTHILTMKRFEKTIYLTTPAPMTQEIIDDMIKTIEEESAYDFTNRLHKLENHDGQTAVIVVMNIVEKWTLSHCLKDFDVLFFYEKPNEDFSNNG